VYNKLTVPSPFETPVTVTVFVFSFESVTLPSPPVTVHAGDAGVPDPPEAVIFVVVAKKPPAQTS